ncbi:MAG: hypothetical protein HQK50_17050 [Oligoflexia bacterium]|nr:hypothetical protein [Oligoflexia bacterium]
MEPNPDEQILLKKARELSYREKIMEWRGVDPLKCKDCGRTMEIVEIWIKGKGTVYDWFKALARASLDTSYSNVEKITSEPEMHQLVGIQLELDFVF